MPRHSSVRITGNKARRLLRLREAARKSQGGLCFWCETVMTRATGSGHRHTDCSADFVTPISAGGRVNEWNIVAACRRCNSSRGNEAHEHVAMTEDNNLPGPG